MNAKQISYLLTNYVLAAFIGLGYPSCHVESYKISFFANDRKKLFVFIIWISMCMCIKKKCKKLLGQSMFMFALRCFLLVIFLKSVRLDTTTKHLKARSVQLKAPHLLSLPIPLRLPPPVHLNPLLCRQPPLFEQPIQVLAVNAFLNYFLLNFQRYASFWAATCMNYQNNNFGCFS